MEGILNVVVPSIVIVLIIHLLRWRSLFRFVLLICLAISSTFFVAFFYCEILKSTCSSDPLVGLGYLIHSILVIVMSFTLEIIRTNLIINLKNKSN
jgi:hypothetical protein